MWKPVQKINRGLFLKLEAAELCGQRETMKSLVGPSLTTRFVIWPIRVVNESRKSGRADLNRRPHGPEPEEEMGGSLPTRLVKSANRDASEAPNRVVNDSLRKPL